MLVFYSRFGNTKKMLKKLNIDIQHTSIDNYEGNEKFIMITPTYEQGNVPEQVVSFLEKNHKNMIAVISSGNMIWGRNFAKAGNIISEKYNVPLLCKYELTGINGGIQKLRKVICEFYGIHQTE